MIPTLALTPLILAGASQLVLGQTQNPDPVAEGDFTTGWLNIPEPVGASYHSDWQVADTNFPVLISDDTVDNADIKHAVIVVPGKHRDCWLYWNTMHNALINASSLDLGVKVEETSVMSPCFLAEIDKAGAADDDTLIFGLTTWASGHYSVGPKSAGKVSSYQVLDELVEYYMDTDEFPNLNTVIVAGHSLGAQLVQRYAALRKTADSDDRLHYWVANPGSILWLVEDRPLPEHEEDCDGFDEFKYGLDGNFPGYALGDANDMGRSGLVDRYRSRNIHYAWGLEDHGPGDTRCQALTEGLTHLERGQNFDAMLHNMTGGMPSAQTIDYVPGISHNDKGMMTSEAGMDKLFVLNYNKTSSN